MKLQSIQILRGIAALLVVVYHIRAQEVLAIGGNGLSEMPFLNGFVNNGFAGVDLFFVISGFIMVYVTDGVRPGLKSSLDFLFARATRIYPLWWFFSALMITMMIAYNLLGFGANWERALQGQPMVPYLFKSFFLIPQYAFPLPAVGWTLVHEMYFYAAFTLILLAPRRFLLWILLVWGLVIAGGAMVGMSKPLAIDYASLVLSPMTMEFILGAVVGVAVGSGVAWRSGLMTLFAILWLAGSLTFHRPDDLALITWNRIIEFGLPCTLLVYGFATLELSKRQAWLVPAGIGALTAAMISFLYGLPADSPFDQRAGAAIVTVLVGAVAMMASLWFGWLGGQSMPNRLRRTTPYFEACYKGLARLGDWSFSLYLCHVILLTLTRLAFGFLGDIPALAPIFQLGHKGPLDNIALVMVCLAASIIAAGLSYRLIERPMIIGFSGLRERLFHSDPTKPQVG
ncbi:acyltransferase [Hyphomonas oceanitis]|uniref:acyltransferase family protein n=1 Tax=Hyphomonas oceanitis TaxID=81033 RepID=UPI0030010F9A